MKRNGRGKLFQPPGDARLVEVVGRHFHFDAVANGEAHPAFAHFAADGGEDDVLVVQFDAEHGSGQNRLDTAFYFNVFFFGRGSHADEATGKIKKAGFGSPEPRHEKILERISNVRDGQRHRHRRIRDGHHHRRHRERVLHAGGRH